MSQVRNTSGLKPFKPGDVGNPEGRNQYTYRKDAEETFNRLLKAVDDRDEGTTVSGAIIADILMMARERDKWALDKVVDRILPVVTKHEVDITDDPERARLADTLAALAARRRTNGSGRSPDATSAEGAGS